MAFKLMVNAIGKVVRKMQRTMSICCAIEKKGCTFRTRPTQFSAVVTAFSDHAIDSIGFKLTPNDDQTICRRRVSWNKVEEFSNELLHLNAISQRIRLRMYTIWCLLTRSTIALIRHIYAMQTNHNANTKQY